MSGLLTLAALVGLSYYYVNNMNQSKTVISMSKMDSYDEFLKKYAKIYGVSWRILKAHIGAATDYGKSSWHESQKPWGQNRLGLLGMRGDDFVYVRDDILDSNITTSSRKDLTIAIEYGAAFLKVINAKFPNDPNNQVVAFYLGLDKQGVAESGDIFTWQEYLGKFNEEYSKIIQRQKE